MSLNHGFTSPQWNDFEGLRANYNHQVHYGTQRGMHAPPSTPYTHSSVNNSSFEYHTPSQSPGIASKQLYHSPQMHHQSTSWWLQEKESHLLNQDERLNDNVSPRWENHITEQQGSINKHFPHFYQNHNLLDNEVDTELTPAIISPSMRKSVNQVMDQWSKGRDELARWEARSQAWKDFVFMNSSKATSTVSKDHHIQDIPRHSFNHQRFHTHPSVNDQANDIPSTNPNKLSSFHNSSTQHSIRTSQEILRGKKSVISYSSPFSPNSSTIERKRFISSPEIKMKRINQTIVQDVENIEPIIENKKSLFPLNEHQREKWHSSMIRRSAKEPNTITTTNDKSEIQTPPSRNGSEYPIHFHSSSFIDRYKERKNGRFSQEGNNTSISNSVLLHQTPDKLGNKNIESITSDSVTSSQDSGSESLEDINDDYEPLSVNTPNSLLNAESPISTLTKSAKVAKPIIKGKESVSDFLKRLKSDVRLALPKRKASPQTPIAERKSPSKIFESQSEQSHQSHEEKSSEQLIQELRAETLSLRRQNKLLELKEAKSTDKLRVTKELLHTEQEKVKILTQDIESLRRDIEALEKENQTLQSKCQETPNLQQSYTISETEDTLTPVEILPEVETDKSISTRDSQEDEVQLPSRLLHCLKEFLATEKYYVEALQLLKTTYMIPMREKGILPEKVLNLVFDQLPTLLSINTDFLEELEKIFDQYLEVDLLILAKELSHLFISFAHRFKSYDKYICNYKMAIASISQNSNPRAEQFFEETTNELMRLKSRSSNLTAYLVQPIQRLPRYRLLLQELAKYIHDEVILAITREAIKHSDEIALYCNSKQREADKREETEKVLLQLDLRNDISPYSTVYLFQIQEVRAKVSGKILQASVYAFEEFMVVQNLKKKQIILISFTDPTFTYKEEEKALHFQFKENNRSFALSIYCLVGGEITFQKFVDYIPEQLQKSQYSKNIMPSRNIEKLNSMDSLQNQSQNSEDGNLSKSNDLEEMQYQNLLNLSFPNPYFIYIASRNAVAT